MKRISSSTLSLIFIFLMIAVIVGWFISLHNKLDSILDPILPSLLFIIVIGLGFLYVRILHDAAARKATEEKLQESEARFRLIFDTTAAGLALVSLQGEWLQINAALCTFLGYTESELLALDFKKISYPPDLAPSLENLKRLLAGKVDSFQMEKRYIHKNGQIVWGLITVSLIRKISGEPLYIVAQIQDINNIKKAEQQLSYQAYHDTLTGLANRNRLEQSLASAIDSALRFQQNFAVFFLDLDHFKNINDSLGHDAGDQLLQVVAKRLKNNTRATDVVSRLGGDEFVLILAGLRGLEAAAAFAEKIINCLLEPIFIHEHPLYITTSIGISFYPTDGDNFETLLKNADLALYQAKQAGRNNYQFCTPEISAKIKEKKAFEATLQNALHENELQLYFQPKFELATQSVTGLETLLHWENKHYGIVAPQKIIELAQEAKLIIPLSQWILKAACTQVNSWHKQGFISLGVGINIAAMQYKQHDFIRHILDILTEIHFDPHYLELEINESLIMQDPEATLIILNQLHDHGVQITIDNFGTGYSSLSYLHKFAINYIKIDKIFIKNIGVNTWHESLVIAMISLAKNLGINVIAQGVETKIQYDFLKQQGCHEVQGYYISPPITAKSIPDFLQKASAGLVVES